MKYWELIEELKDIYTELSYNSRFVRIAMFHLIGKTLLENSETSMGKIDKIASVLNVTASDIATAIIFAKKYPDLDNFNHDKTVNWETVKKDLDEETQTK